MSDQYNFTWSDPTKKPGFAVLPQTTDTTDSPLTLVGRGSPNWGQGLQQNMLYMLENWASATAPALPTTGQLWYNTTTQILYVYDSSMVSAPGGPWRQAGGGSVSQSSAPTNNQLGQLWYNTSNGVLSVWNGTGWSQIYPNLSSVRVAWVTEYNAMADLINQIVGAPTGATLATAYGWNQGSTAIAHETTTSLTNAKWITLLNRIVSISNFLGQPTSGISTDGFVYETGNTIPYGITTMLTKYTSTFAALTALGAGTVRFKPAAANLESTTPSTGTQTRATAWNNTITHTITCQFADAPTMYAFFNAGGQIQFLPSLANPLTNRDLDVKAFLAARGTVAFSATGTVDSSAQANTVGLYNLTTSNQQIFGVLGSASDPMGQDKYIINAVLTNAYTIQFQVQYTSTGTLYGGVGGTLTSKTTLVRPAAAQLNSPVIAYPTVTQSASIS